MGRDVQRLIIRAAVIVSSCVQGAAPNSVACELKGDEDVQDMLSGAVAASASAALEPSAPDSSKRMHLVPPLRRQTVDGSEELGSAFALQAVWPHRGGSQRREPKKKFSNISKR